MNTSTETGGRGGEGDNFLKRGKFSGVPSGEETASCRKSGVI